MFDKNMLDTIAEEDVDQLRRVLYKLFLLSACAEFGLAIFLNVRAFETWGAIYDTGFVMLGITLLISIVYQLIFASACKRESALEIFQQPCILRWASYAMTWPISIFVTAWYGGVKQLDTLLMLVVAEVVCALLGFVMEQAWVSADLEEPAVPQKDPITLSVGRVVQGPQANTALILTQRQKAGVSWLLCFFCVVVLHGVVWFVVENDKGKEIKLDGIDTLVHIHFALISAIWVVPPLQVLIWFLGVASVEEALVAGSVAFAVLDVAVKLQISVAYMLFVVNV